VPNYRGEIQITGREVIRFRLLIPLRLGGQGSPSAFHLLISYLYNYGRPLDFSYVKLFSYLRTSLLSAALAEGWLPRKSAMRGETLLYRAIELIDNNSTMEYLYFWVRIS